MKQYKLKLFFLIIIFIGLFLLVANSLKHGWWNGSSDYRLAVFGQDKILLVSISPNRALINELLIEGEVKVWIPKGLGWYRADKIGKILTQEDKWKLATLVSFYNFGFWPDQIISIKKVDEWDSLQGLIKSSGLVKGVRLKSMIDSFLIKYDLIRKDFPLSSESEKLLSRDYADTELLSKDTRITITNASDQNGAADWLSKRLTWAGFTVMETLTADEGKGCIIRVSPKNETVLHQDKLLKYLMECIIESNESVLPNQIELIIGDEWVKMLQYNNYVGAF